MPILNSWSDISLYLVILWSWFISVLCAIFIWLYAISIRLYAISIWLYLTGMPFNCLLLCSFCYLLYQGIKIKLILAISSSNDLQSSGAGGLQHGDGQNQVLCCVWWSRVPAIRLISPNQKILFLAEVIELWNLENTSY